MMGLQTPRINLGRYLPELARAESLRMHGIVRKVAGLVIETSGPLSSIGEMCLIRSQNGNKIAAEVVGFTPESMLLMPLGEMRDFRPSDEVIPTGEPLMVSVGGDMLGRVLDGLGRPIDGGGPIAAECRYPVHAAPPSPFSRERIREPLPSGIRAIDALLTMGCGQRMGLFAGSGIGKSTLLGMIARRARCDVNVIALVGERGREVREFIEKDLGDEGLKRSVVIVATSDQPALVRIKAALVATSIAEFFRDEGKKVMLMMDSVTRFAAAQREVGLAIGEPPTVRGYPPSVFAFLPRLLERTGQGERGSITGLYTVLVDGDDHNEPVADAIRGILDGHVVLNRELATRNLYPPIDILHSISRVMFDVTAEEHRHAANVIRDLLSVYRRAEDLIQIGAYSKGSDPKLDKAIEIVPKIEEFLKQGIDEAGDFNESIGRIQEISRG